MFVRGLKTDPELVLNIGMTPQKLPAVVTHNPNLAFELLICMNNLRSITKYFDQLAVMKVSLNTLEVFNQLSTHVDLPQEFIHLFLKNCINQCRALTDNRMNKCRLVRLLCVFMQSLFKSRLIQLQDVQVELQAFCIEFSDIREANAIYKMISSEQAQRNLMQSSGGGGAHQQPGQ